MHLMSGKNLYLPVDSETVCCCEKVRTQHLPMWFCHMCLWLGKAHHWTSTQSTPNGVSVPVLKTCIFSFCWKKLNLLQIAGQTQLNLPPRTVCSLLQIFAHEEHHFFPEWRQNYLIRYRSFMVLAFISSHLLSQKESPILESLITTVSLYLEGMRILCAPLGVLQLHSYELDKDNIGLKIQPSFKSPKTSWHLNLWYFLVFQRIREKFYSDMQEPIRLQIPRNGGHTNLIPTWAHSTWKWSCQGQFTKSH